MFSKSQLELIKYAVFNRLVHIQQSQIPASIQRLHSIEPTAQASDSTIVTKIKELEELLDTIEEYLNKTSFKGQAYLDIPNKDGESWHNVMTGPAQDALELAVTNYGANEFGFVSLITLGEAPEEDEIDEDQNSAT